MSAIDSGREDRADALIFLAPAFREKIWGGNRLLTEWGYPVKGAHIGECWAVSAAQQEEEASVVRRGPYAGLSLYELWRQFPEIFGRRTPGQDRFPLLVKIIDAREDLSIQVHPDDAYAAANEKGSPGKTECWYVLDCPEGAQLVVGHNARSREELRSMTAAGQWDALIRRIPVRRGDFIQIEPGTVHAITAGVMVLETQQSSDITYRLYDYGRLDHGHPRQLHIGKSLDVITVPAGNPENAVLHTQDFPENELRTLISCAYYSVYCLFVRGEMTIARPAEADFLIASAIRGEAAVNGETVRMGDHFLLPHDAQTITVAGDADLILSAPGMRAVSRQHGV